MTDDRAGAAGPRGLAALALMVLAAACSKSEPAAQASRTAPASAPAPVAAAPAAGPEVNDAFKERLARQEAAAKLFDKAKPEPAPEAAKKPAVSAPVAPAPEPPRAAAPAPEPPRAAALPPARPAPEPAKPAPTPSPRTEAPAAEPARAPAPVLAAAAPQRTPPAAPATQAARVLSRVDVSFPREAIRAGHERGLVKARMTLDASGSVAKVDVMEAQPQKVFDRAVVQALSQWKFNEGAAGRTVETEVEFRR